MHLMTLAFLQIIINGGLLKIALVGIPNGTYANQVPFGRIRASCSVASDGAHGGYGWRKHGRQCTVVHSWWHLPAWH